MTETAVELDAAFLYSVKYGLLAHQCCASLSCGGSGGGIGVTDDGDAQVGLYGVWEADAVAHYGTVLERFEAEVQFVLGGRRRAANLGGANVATWRQYSYSYIWWYEKRDTDGVVGKGMML